MDLPVGNAFTIPESELEWTFTTSGGPGGQHASRTASQAELRWNLETSAVVDEELRSLLSSRLGNRARDGLVKVIAGESRSQWQNRQQARKRLAELLEGALREPRRRVPTKPPGAVKRSRVADKRRQGDKKRLRQKPEVE